MASFLYVVKSASGEELRGLHSAGSLDEVANYLHAQGYTILHLAEERVRRLSAARRWSPIGGRVRTRDLALFTRQLATVFASGIPLARGLRGLAADSSSRTLARATADMTDRLQRGESLSEAMSAHPRIFNELYVSMIRAGERAGTLEDILEKLAEYLEKVDAIRTKVRSAMAYPVFVLLFALGATAFLLLKIVPTFAELYATMDQALPTLTLTVLSVSQAVRANALLVLFAALGIVLLVSLWMHTAGGRFFRDRLLLRLPVFGPIVRQAVMSRFARTFGILMRSGLPILDTLALVRATAGNEAVGRAIDRARRHIEAGHGITDSFRAARRFPEMVLQLMATGEETGDIDGMLMKASDFYDRQVEASVHGLTSLIEPLMIVLVGSLIGVIVVSMFLPIFHLGEAVMRGGQNL